MITDSGVILMGDRFLAIILPIEINRPRSYRANKEKNLKHLNLFLEKRMINRFSSVLCLRFQNKFCD